MKGQFDLFGHMTVIPEKSLYEEYTEYLKSSRWKRIREEKIKSVEGKCERCHISKWSTRLEVHHKDYKHFKRERLEDLEVLCGKCHPLGDEERRNQKEVSKRNSAIVRGFVNWMDAGDNQGWRRLSNERLGIKWKEFLNYLERHGGKHYEIKFWRDPEWY